MVVEAGSRGDKVREKLVNEGNTGDVKRHVEAAAKVMVYGVDYNVENRSSRWTRV